LPETPEAALEPEARILVVDDSRFVRGYVAELLEDAGYSVTQAEDGAGAVRLLERESFDVIVTDLNMPALDGFAVLETVKLRQLAAEVVILTGSHARDIDSAIRALRLGAHDFLTKPLVAPGQALVAVERALTTKRQRQALLRAERRYRQLLEQFPVGVYRSRMDGVLIEVNSALTGMLDYPSAEALLAVNARDLYVNLEDRRLWQERLAREGVLAHFDVRLRRRGGSTIWVEESARVEPEGPEGETTYAGCLVDISHRRSDGGVLGVGALDEQIGAIIEASEDLSRLGGEGGNEVLSQLAERVRSAAEAARGLLRPGKETPAR
jgi:PAS domain S-box-containing protein